MKITASELDMHSQEESAPVVARRCVPPSVEDMSEYDSFRKVIDTHQWTIESVQKYGESAILTKINCT